MLGDTVGNTYSIVSGLNPGDRVIVSGTQFLVDGMPVMPMGGRSACSRERRRIPQRARTQPNRDAGCNGRAGRSMAAPRMAAPSHRRHAGSGAEDKHGR